MRLQATQHPKSFAAAELPCVNIVRHCSVQNASIAFPTRHAPTSRPAAASVSLCTSMPEQELFLQPVLKRRTTNRCIIYGRPYDHHTFGFHYFLNPAVESEVFSQRFQPIQLQVPGSFQPCAGGAQPCPSRSLLSTDGGDRATRTQLHSPVWVLHTAFS